MISRIRALFNGAFRGERDRVVTRFAPSPTGFLHAGNYRTAVFSYIFARQHSGKFVLRIEDTDKARSKKEYEDNILDSLDWLGLPYDELFRQSDRSDLYRKYLQKLLDEGKAYLSKEEPNEQGQTDRPKGSAKTAQRSEVIRFKNPNKKVAFDDLIRGRIEFDTTDLGDFVIAKSVDEPIFHFAVVLDDYLMKITHVIRGEDHISNTPRQILIQEALGAPTPIYAHLPLVLAHDRSKLSKRHGAQPMTHYRDQGFLPDALLNYMALLGWNPGDDREVFDLDGLIDAFDLSRVQKGGAIFNEQKLRWINKEHLKLMPQDALTREIKGRVAKSARAKDLGWDVTDSVITRIAPVLVERIDTFGDLDTLIESQDLDYYFAEPTYDAISLRWKEDSDTASTRARLEKVRGILADIAEKHWTEEGIKEKIWPYAEEEGRGKVLWPLRFSLSGKERSPNPFTLAAILGKSETLARVDRAVDICRNAELANA